MRYHNKKRSKKAGLPPGSLVLTGEQDHGAPQITVLNYDEAACTEHHVASAEEVLPLKDGLATCWIHVGGLQVDVVRSLGEGFGLHPLVQEDILSTDQRPKLEDYGDYLFIVLKSLSPNDSGDLASEQVSLVVGPRWVLSFSEKPGQPFAPVRDRLQAGTGRLRKMGADYLAYSLLDCVVDGYFGTLERTGEDVETLEERLVARPDPEILRDVYRLKRDLVFLRKAVWPLREVLASLARGESPLVQESTKIYLRDVYDHTVQIMDIIETFRDMSSTMLDVYLSGVSNRLNEVMKVLTIIATIFIPLTFIAGIYGMNFDMPELKWPHAYPILLGVMACIAIGMLIAFRRKHWL